MKKYLKNILLFLLLLFLYFLPTLIFKADNKYYDSLNKPFFAPKPIIFSLCWSILYIIFAILLIKILKKEFRQGLVIMGINYFISFFFIFFFFVKQNLFLSFSNTFLSFCSGLLLFLYFMKKDRYLAFMVTPYLLWTGFASVLMCTIYFLN